MSEPWTDIAGDVASGMLIVADHASNHVPADVLLGIDPALLKTHIAIDIGVVDLAGALCGRLGCPAILGAVSRLVIDLNREEDADGLIPSASDGHSIVGNAALSAENRKSRIDRYWRPYHRRIERELAVSDVKLLISIHSFTPRLATSDSVRPWQIGILYNQDDRAARVALPKLAGADVVTGDNLPYSGKILNATMNRHGEANGIAYLGIEVRQDLIADAAGVERWAEILAPIVLATANEIAGG